jgi:hypothetical protein
MEAQPRTRRTPFTPSTMKTPNHTDPETKKKEKKNEVDERSKPDGKKTTTQKK